MATTRTGINQLGITALVIAASFGFGKTAAARSYHHIGQLADDYHCQVERLSAEVQACYRGVPEYGTLLLSTQQMCRAADRIGATAVSNGGLNRIDCDLRELSVLQKNFQCALDRIDARRSRHGSCRTIQLGCDTRAARRILCGMEETRCAMAAAVEQMRNCHVQPPRRNISFPPATSPGWLIQPSTGTIRHQVNRLPHGTNHHSSGRHSIGYPSRQPQAIPQRTYNQRGGHHNRHNDTGVRFTTIGGRPGVSIGGNGFAIRFGF